MKRLMGREPVEYEEILSAGGWRNDALLFREVMARRDDAAEFELEMIHRKLQLIDSNKAIDLSKQIIKDMNWRVLMEEVFRYLASLDSTEVEDIFIAYLIDTDYDAKDICRKIVDEYLSKR